jgi:cytochrome c peroxidase
MKTQYKAGLLTAALALAAVALVVPRHLASPALSDSLASDPDHGRISADAVAPLPHAPEQPSAKLTLGERLFHDRRLSRDDSLSCASCHDLGRGGTDRRKFSIGVGGAVGGINAPTVFNSSLSFVQFWDGRAATLEEQAAGPIHNPLEMASNWDEVLPKLRADAGYVDGFFRLYPDGITAANVLDAIASFERSLVTPDSRFDRYLRGEREAMTQHEIDGYQRFRALGCTSCHQGVLLGGNMYQKFGVMRDYFADRAPTEADLGRYNVTKRAEDRHVFKVPSLRNVVLTAPYFHDASADTLEAAVVVMARHQLGREIESRDVDAIVAFLRTLTGQWRGKTLE